MIFKYMRETAQVSDYMTTNLTKVEAEDNITVVRDLLRETGYDGFPVCDSGDLVGHISAKDVVCSDSDESKVRSVMNSNYPTVSEDFPVVRAGRILFREGISEILVLDDDGQLSGILSNSDIIRSQIERTTPSKVESLSDMLEKVHEDVKFEIGTKEFTINELNPTQAQVFQDELQGRIHELKNGLAEPIIVVDNIENKVVADGHHRIVASRQINKDKILAYSIEPSSKVELGMYKQAKENGLESFSDIEIIKDKGHPHISNIRPVSDVRKD